MTEDSDFAVWQGGPCPPWCDGDLESHSGYASHCRTVQAVLDRDGARQLAAALVSLADCGATE
jgi:hypothetical protein